MENSIMNSWGIDPAYIIIGLSALVLILMIIVIVCIINMRRLYRRYDYFMRGKDAESMEDIILEQIDEIKRLRAEDRANKDSIRTLNRNQKSEAKRS